MTPRAGYLDLVQRLRKNTSWKAHRDYPSRVTLHHSQKDQGCNIISSRYPCLSQRCRHNRTNLLRRHHNHKRRCQVSPAFLTARCTRQIDVDRVGRNQLPRHPFHRHHPMPFPSRFRMQSMNPAGCVVRVLPVKSLAHNHKATIITVDNLLYTVCATTDIIEKIRGLVSLLATSNLHNYFRHRE